jgi:hypothetical protein
MRRLITYRGILCGKFKPVARLMGPFALASTLLSACAPMSQRPNIDEAAIKEEVKRQKEATVQTYLDHVKRAELIGEKIRINSASLCPKKNYTLGLSAFSPVLQPDEWKGALHRIGYKDGLTVLTVAKGTPADVAGIRPGDFLVNVDGVQVTKDKEQIQNALVRLQQEGERKLVLLRGEEKIEVSATSLLSCDYPINIIISDVVNAFADGKKVILHTSILNLAATEIELAMIIGHEIAHNTREHITSKQVNMAVGMAFGAALEILLGVPGAMNIGADIGGGVYSQEFEHEADYVGLYYVARAGYDISQGPGVWRRMGASNPRSISHGSSHPATAERFIALETAVQEIKEKIASGKPLLPNERAETQVKRPSVSQSE